MQSTCLWSSREFNRCKTLTQQLVIVIMVFQLSKKNVGLWPSKWSMVRVLHRLHQCQVVILSLTKEQPAAVNKKCSLFMQWSILEKIQLKLTILQVTRSLGGSDPGPVSRQRLSKKCYVQKVVWNWSWPHTHLLRDSWSEMQSVLLRSFLWLKVKSPKQFF